MTTWFNDEVTRPISLCFTMDIMEHNKVTPTGVTCSWSRFESSNIIKILNNSGFELEAYLASENAINFELLGKSYSDSNKSDNCDAFSVTIWSLSTCTGKVHWRFAHKTGALHIKYIYCVTLQGQIYAFFIPHIFGKFGFRAKFGDYHLGPPYTWKFK